MATVKVLLPHVTIIGVGGMGSRIAEAIVRMSYASEGLKLSLVDPDCFEEKNLANQYLDRTWIGKQKVDAVAHQLHCIDHELDINVYPYEMDETVPLSPIVFMCLDSMDARKEIMEELLENDPSVQCVIETRLDSGVGISHCFDPRNQVHQDCWWLYWHRDEEAENTVGCGGHHSVISAVYGTAMLALRQFEQFLSKQTTHGLANRVYQDFDHFECRSEVWPT